MPEQSTTIGMECIIVRKKKKRDARKKGRENCFCFVFVISRIRFIRTPLALSRRSYWQYKLTEKKTQLQFERLLTISLIHTDKYLHANTPKKYKHTSLFFFSRGKQNFLFEKSGLSRVVRSLIIARKCRRRRRGVLLSWRCSSRNNGWEYRSSEVSDKTSCEGAS